ncbi:MAG: hypothetical protein JO304_10575 [Solirubrobacterales bacterium]|nr:hypothetical protein [Solirubrobacterales bacterium]MBV9310613.1 hypothetical protein [Solirubrobacterales bacterium]
MIVELRRDASENLARADLNAWWHGIQPAGECAEPLYQNFVGFARISDATKSPGFH